MSPTFNDASDLNCLDRLEHLHAWLHALIEGAPGMIAIFDAYGRLVHFNDSYKLHFRHVFVMEIAAGLHLSSLLKQCPEYRDLTIVDFQRALQGDGFEVVRRIRKPQSGDHILNVRYQPVFQKDGTSIGVAMILRDQTEQHAAESVARQQEESFKCAFENAPIGMALISPEGRFLRVNHSLLGIVGYSREELLSLSLRDITHQDDLDAALGQARRLLSRELTRYEMDKRYLHRDGHEVWVHLTCSLVWHNDAPRYFIAQIQDISHQKEIEQALIRAKDEAEAADRSKSNFLAVMSHELRTPMNAVIGFSDLLLAGDLDNEQREYIETISRSGETLISLINDILDFSKVEAGKLVLEERPVSIESIINEVIAIWRSRADEKGLMLKAEILPGLPEFVAGDQLRIHQVINNLVNNAIKFTDEGEVLIKAGVELRGGVEHVRIEVADTGCGVPPDQTNKLFQPFCQGDSSTTRKHGGTGLGLAICKRLVEAMGGEILIQESSPEGSTFSFHLPMQTIDDFEEFRSPVTDKQLLRGMHALMVDAQPAQRRVLQHLLTTLGIVATPASCGSEALLKIERGRFDIVICDIMTPDMDGATLARRIRSRHTPERLPMLLLTTSPARHPLVQEGTFQGQVARPLRPGALQQGIVSAVTTSRRRPSPLIDNGKPRVLVVDDNELSRALLERMLIGMNHITKTANDATEGLDALRQEPFDLVFMDVNLPGMSGLEAARRMRQLEAQLRHEGKQSPPVKIVALTAAVLPGDQQKCLQAGMDAYLPKPLRLNQIRAVMHDLLGTGEMLELAR